MKKQVVVIHGGRTFLAYQDYIDSLKKREVVAEKFKAHKSWRDGLQEKLGEDFEVFAPKMPNGFNAVYEEWKIWFLRLAEFLHDDVVLVGHSLGGIFLAKYLSENTFAQKVRAAVLVAAPFDDNNLNESLGDFILPDSLEHFSVQAGRVCLCFSKDDPVVPFSHMGKYKKVLPNAIEMPLENRQHFEQEDFLELVKLINNIFNSNIHVI